MSVTSRVRVLYASARAYVPDRVDGALYAAHSLLAILKRRGHAVEAVASIGKEHARRVRAYRVMRALSARRLLSLPDNRNGYPTRRAWESLVDDLTVARIRAFRPDVLLTQLDGCESIAKIGIEHGIPTILWVHDNEFSFFKGRMAPHPLLLTPSDSDFVARAVEQRSGHRSPVLYPVVNLERCLATRDADPYPVTFINPVKEKGVDIALAVAKRLPHRRFQFVESWPLRGERLEALERALADLPNVTFRRVSPDVRAVYASTRVLLAPSQWVESFCTVVFEANANGIPVVASRIGGIPVTLGDGGLLVDPQAPAETWAEAVEGLLADQDRYDLFSQRALANAARRELNPDGIVDKFVELATAHVAGGRASAAGEPLLQTA